MAWPDPRPLRILVIRYRFIGDTVLAIPTLRNLRAAFPHATIDALVEPIAGDTLAHCPYLNEILYHRPGKKYPVIGRQSWLRLWETARLVRGRRYDRCYLLRRSFSSALVPFYAGIPHRIGFGTEMRQILLHRVAPYDTSKHEVECFLDVLRADDVPVTSTHNENWSDPRRDAEILSQLPRSRRHRVLLSARSHNPRKEWTNPHFAAVIDWLIREADCEIHICDAPNLAPTYAPIRAALGPEQRPHWHDWSHLPIRDVGSLVRHIDLYFGVDTGMAHIAASFHKPAVVLIDPRAVAHWHPWDTPHAIVSPPATDPANVPAIPPAQAISALQGILSCLPA